MNNKKVVVLLSGGIDSTTCLAIAKAMGNEVVALNVFYGQRHAREIQSAKAVAEYYGVELLELDMARIFEKSDCSLLASSGKEIEKKPYSEQERENGKPVATYVPFRNGLMLSAAAAIAVSVEACSVWYGAHADDVAGSAYPDCSVEFTKAMNEAINEGTANQVQVIAPFVGMNKAEVVKEGLRLKAPYHLTWSCYEGGEHPCGKCGTCIDREKAFRENGVEDPVK